MYQMMLAFIKSNIIDSDLQKFVIQIMNMLPGYFWTVPASSSGKYHPAFSLGEGGLVRHSILVARFARRIALAQGMTDREQDLMTISGLIHDGMKQGEGDGGHTVHEHPVLIANLLRENFAGNQDAEFIAHVVESHMGQWTTSKYSEVVLPAPKDAYQCVLSAADMIAADKGLGLLPDMF